jgi:hypothetical protein
MLSRDSDWVLQLKISRTWRPWAVWSVGFCGVRFLLRSRRFFLAPKSDNGVDDRAVGFKLFRQPVDPGDDQGRAVDLTGLEGLAQGGTVTVVLAGLDLDELLDQLSGAAVEERRHRLALGLQAQA